MNSDKFEYFIEQTNQDLDYIKSRLDSLMTFRAMLLGGAAMVSVACSGIVCLLTIYFDTHR